MPGTTAAKFYPRTLGTGSVRELATAAEGAAVGTTKAAFNSTTVKRLVPFTTVPTGTTNALPAANAAAGGAGWRLTSTLLEGTATEPRYLPGTAINWQWRMTSDQVLGVATTLTVIAYRISSVGVSTELGRVSSGSVNLTTTATLFNVNVPISDVTFAAGESLQFELYVASAAGALGATSTITASIDAASNVNIVAPGVRTRYLRTPADSAPAADAPARQVTFPRATADVAASSDTVARQVAVARAMTDTARAADTPTRMVTFARAVADASRAQDTAARTVIFNRSASDAAPASDQATRAVSLARQLADAAPASDTLERQLTYVRQVREDLGAGGAGTVVEVVREPAVALDTLGQLSIHLGGGVYL
jgi:hypothetical protein